MSKKTKLMHAFTMLAEVAYRRPLQLLKLPSDKTLYAGKSYYPEQKQSGKWSNMRYQAGQIIRFGHPNRFFFMYGLDVKDKAVRKEYVNYMQFRNRRMELNVGDKEYTTVCILRNKLYFDIFAKGIQINTPRIKAFMSNGEFHVWDNGFRNAELTELTTWPDQTLFCKETEGECGMGIFKLTISAGKLLIAGEEISAQELAQKLGKANYLMQELVVQHERMNELYAGSINTIRLVTVRSLKDGQIHVMPSILRIGANGSFVDNTSQGGIAVGFDLDSGQLHANGFHKPEFGGIVTEHPNSHIRLADFCIPNIKQAEEEAIRFHSMLGDIHSVGWDIAIGPEGPIFIEGNDNWEINGPQVGNHGLMKEFKEYFYE